jgi:DNA-binding XRE family transcriptional regulator
LESSQRHRRVAFPLPGVPLIFRWLRPKTYPERPSTLGEHLLKRRSLTGLTQRQVASEIDVNTWTYLLWETDRATPTVRYWPAIVRFLGYRPWPEPQTLPEMIMARRRLLGLTVLDAAKLTGVDEGTFRRWEHGDWQPRLANQKLRVFLAGS